MWTDMHCTLYNVNGDAALCIMHYFAALCIFFSLLKLVSGNFSQTFSIFDMTIWLTLFWSTWSRALGTQWAELRLTHMLAWHVDSNYGYAIAWELLDWPFLSWVSKIQNKYGPHPLDWWILLQMKCAAKANSNVKPWPKRKLTVALHWHRQSHIISACRSRAPTLTS